MRLLLNKRERFHDVINDYSSLYNYSNKKEQLTISAGVLNFIWNHWNNFWRDYWIAHVSGGIDFNGIPITPIHNNYTDKQSCHYLLYACGKKNSHNSSNSINGVHQEATWGDPILMTNIATTMLTHHTHMTYLLGLLGHYQTYIQHFQRIRNSFIHLNNENVNKLNTLTGYYTFSPNHRLIDILETTEITTATKCFDNLLNNMTGLIQNL
ncbi:hypothetical protein [Chryseobacterium sp. G0201]|uniref:hypothetical protein n=1 Tax=Chryseobacterium sp. G0201 TaxID=2487065 RepID=UPI000F4F0D76|nr:hypothetical protein [Chryseobacterium sp. G0201]AZA54613.1 hypothetical protein EG348_17240 [Chryseobacterium sp. G0201]